jgi:hypothetical protein
VASPFDPGYGAQPFLDLCRTYPGADVYPQEDFRLEWGPVFHRGRLDGSARVLVVGQDPAQHETIARRILVGEAGHRVQGFLAKLGIERSYVMVNTFLYSVFGGSGGGRWNDEGIVEYRHRWLDALVAPGQIEAVVALGFLADKAWRLWKQTPAGSTVDPVYAKITHPTQPESAGGGDAAEAAATAAMLATWNAGLEELHPGIEHRDVDRPLVRYGHAFADGDKAPIPADDLPAGMPEWMRLDDGWAFRAGATAEQKRATITVTVPERFLP